MGIIQSLLGRAPPPPIPPELPNLVMPTAAIVRSCEPGPEAAKLYSPGQTPAQYLTALQDHWLGDDMVKFLLHGLPDKVGVAWAAQAAAKVANKLPPGDLLSLHAAQAWLANPTDATQVAALAAAGAGLTGPGAFAAQAAASARTSLAVIGPGSAVPRVAPHAAMGAVLLSAALAANPKLNLPAVAVPLPAAPALPDINPAVPSLSLPGVPLPNLAIPGVPLPNLAGPTVAMPQLTLPALAATLPGLAKPAMALPPVPAPPTVPLKVQVQMFWEKYPAIAMGLALASGQAPAV